MDACIVSYGNLSFQSLNAMKASNSRDVNTSVRESRVDVLIIHFNDEQVRVKTIYNFVNLGNAWKSTTGDLK